MFQGWKKSHLEEYSTSLIEMGFTPEAVHRFTEVYEDGLETAYQYGMTYNEEES